MNQAFALTASLLIVGAYLPQSLGQYCPDAIVEVYQGGTMLGEFPPIQGDAPVVDFYGWTSRIPSFTGPLPTNFSDSIMFVHQDGQCQISIGTVHSAIGQGAGSARMRFFNSVGQPFLPGASLAVEDNPTDQYIIGTSTDMSWTWDVLETAGMAEELDGAGCLTIDPLEFQGISRWLFLPRRDMLSSLLLRMDTSVSICISGEEDSDNDGFCNPAVVSHLCRETNSCQNTCRGTDLCGRTPPGVPTDEHGCSLSQVDEDLDGVCNVGVSSSWCTGSDECPGTRTGQVVGANGCPVGPECPKVSIGISQNGNDLRSALSPLLGTTSVENFYGWTPEIPAFTGELPVSPFKSLLFLYQQGWACQMSLGAVHSDIGQGSGSAQLIFSNNFNASVFTSLTLKDDPTFFDPSDQYLSVAAGTFTDPSSARTTMTWTWDALDSDGMAVEFPTRDGFNGCFTVSPIFFHDIDEWHFISRGNVETPLDTSSAVEVCLTIERSIDDEDRADDDEDGICNPGVVNSPLCSGTDLCSGTPPGAPVDQNGCSAAQVDQDLDGVCNPGVVSSTWCLGSDDCPDTLTGVAVGTDGCPLTTPSPPTTAPPPTTPTPPTTCPKCPLSVFETLPPGCEACVP